MTDCRQLKFGFNIPVNKIYTLLKWIAGINVFFLFGTWLQADKIIFPNSVFAQWLLVQLNLARENVVAAWYSSMLLFSAGIAAALCFWADMQRTDNNKGRLLNYGWIIMAMIFALLSFDEMGSFHEMIGETALFKKAGIGANAGWYAFYALIGAVAVFMVTFFFLKFKNNRFAFLLTLIGVLLFVSNPLQEKFELYSWHNSPDPDNWHRPVLFLLIEEGSELFASFCFLFSFLRYATTAASGNAAAGGMFKLESSVGKNFVFWLTGTACLLGSLMLIIHINAWKIPGDDNGVPQDWPPAATAFIAFAAGMYLYCKKGMEGNRLIYISIAMVSIITTVYFGSYMYGYFEGPFVKMPYFILAITAVASMVAAFKLQGAAAKFFFIAWVVLMALSVFAKDFSSTVYGYAAYSCLMLGLFLHYTYYNRHIAAV